MDRGRGRGAGRGGGGGGGGGVRSDVVFAVSNGVVSSYNDHGRLNWQDRRGPTWERKGVCTVVHWYIGRAVGCTVAE